MSIVWVVIIILLVWWLASRNQKASTKISAPQGEQEVSEEALFAAQNRFEKNLEDTLRPDAITRGELYLYRKLMREWYNRLAAKNRYDGAMTQKLRGDWLDYMEALRERSTCNYLWMESEGKTADNYRERTFTASRKASAIEDAFAAAIGNAAVQQLAVIRNKDLFHFSESGELAPDGFIYDLAGKLKPERHDRGNNSV